MSLQGSHVIGQDQVWVGVVSKGPDNAHLNSSYQTRQERGREGGKLLYFNFLFLDLHQLTWIV